VRQNCTLRVCLVRLRPPKVNQHAIAYVAGNITPAVLDSGPHMSLVRAQQFAKIFGIYAGRQRSGADQVAEHHAKLAPFGLLFSRLFDTAKRR
jgi:hypothetical protein